MEVQTVHSFFFNILLLHGDCSNQYLNYIWFLLYISLANTLSTFTLQKVCVMMVNLPADLYISVSSLPYRHDQKSHL